MKKQFFTIIRKIPFVICFSAVLCAGAFFFLHRYQPIIYEQADGTETSDIFTNPYCGFYRINGFSLSEEISETDAFEWGKQRSSGDSNPLMLLEINLQNYSDTLLTQNALNQLDAILTACSESKKQLILRFLYDWNGNAMETEPSSLEQIKAHMNQVSGTINSHADCIFLLQGVYTGNNGEMHATHYGSAEDITELMNWQASLTDKSIFLAVRTPAHLRSILGTMTPVSSDRAFDGTLTSRLGLYNDGMLGSVYDLGTYDDTPLTNSSDLTEKGTREEELDFQDQLCQYVPNGGEAVLDNEYNDLEHAIADLSRMHVSYLNQDHDPAVINKWKNSVYNGGGPFDGCTGYDYIRAHLGYRYIVSKSSIKFHPLLDDEAALYLTIENTGFAPAYRQFSAKLLFADSETNETVTINAEIDNRKIASGDSSVFTIPFDLRSLKKGEYRVSLSMTDSTSGLPILFANQNTKKDGSVPVGTLTLK